MPTILAIETSCDETAAAIVEQGAAENSVHVRSNVVASQVDLHRRFGGVFPEVASRQHVLAIQPVIEQALGDAGVAHVQELDAIAVTHGPGLVGSLLVGVNAAKGLALGSDLPLLAVNHLEGHVYSNWIEAPASKPAQPDRFPALILIVSGGHTDLLLMKAHCTYERLGGTLDDAAGEAFDKVARLLKLGFPGGPAIQAAAEQGDPQRFTLPRPLAHSAEHRFNFSFSGLKTAVLNLVREEERAGEQLEEGRLAADVAAAFQQATAEVLIDKCIDALQTFGAQQLCICGGVSANTAIRRLAAQRCEELGTPLHIPPLALCTDNAAMIGAAALFRWRAQPDFIADLTLDVAASLPLA